MLIVSAVAVEAIHLQMRAFRAGNWANRRESCQYGLHHLKSDVFQARVSAPSFPKAQLSSSEPSKEFNFDFLAGVPTRQFEWQTGVYSALRDIPALERFRGRETVLPLCGRGARGSRRV